MQIYIPEVVGANRAVCVRFCMNQNRHRPRNARARSTAFRDRMFTRLVAVKVRIVGVCTYLQLRVTKLTASLQVISCKFRARLRLVNELWTHRSLHLFNLSNG
jgi:hypothetical protein